MATYEIFVDSEYTATMNGDFEDAKSRLHLDGIPTPYRVLDADNSKLVAAQMLLKWSYLKGRRLCGLDEKGEVVGYIGV